MGYFSKNLKYHTKSMNLKPINCVSLGKSCHIQLSFKDFFSSDGHFVHWSGAVLVILVESHLATFLCSLSKQYSCKV